MGLKVGWTKKKNKKNKKNDEEKETPPERGDLDAIGLSPSKTSSSISIHNENGTYISHANVAEIKKNYGTIHEYLKQRYGPGKYTITVKGKGGDDTQHISIAGEESPSSWPENPSPVPAGMDGNQLMGIYMSLQSEVARLKAELAAKDNSSQQSMLGQIVPTVIDFFKTMMQSRPDTDLASVMTAATECLKTLSEIKTPGEKSDDVGGLMGGIVQLVQGLQQQKQAESPPRASVYSQPTPTPVYLQAPAPYPPPPVIIPTSPPVYGGMPTVPNPMPLNTVVQPNPSPPDNSSTDVFFENLIGMTEQRQSPKVVADYLIQSIQKIPPQEIQKLDPQMQVLIGQLLVNPVGAFDAICQFEPGLAADGKYTAEIRTELQKIVQG